MDSRFSWSTDYHHPTTWDQAFPPLSLPDMFAASVARKGDAPMLDFMGRQFGYAEVARGAARVARGLQQLGLGKGSRVGLFLPNVPHYVARSADRRVGKAWVSTCSIRWLPCPLKKKQ